MKAIAPDQTTGTIAMIVFGIATAIILFMVIEGMRGG